MKNGSWYRSIVRQDAAKIPEWSNDVKALRAVKYIGGDAYRFRMDMQIYADSVMLYSPTEPVGGAIIRNEKIADSMRSLFDLVWNLI